MLGQDAGWDALPIPGGEGTAAMQDARRDQSGRAKGQPERWEAWRAVTGGANRLTAMGRVLKKVSVPPRASIFQQQWSTTTEPHVALMR